MISPELVPLTEWLQAAARNGYGCSGDGGKVWVLPDIFASVFGFAVDGDSLNLYCQKSELHWLLPAANCTVTSEVKSGCELSFWFLDKIAFVLPIPEAAVFSKVALFLYPDIMADPEKTFPLSTVTDSRCCWPSSAPRFHFIP